MEEKAEKVTSSSADLSNENISKPSSNPEDSTTSTAQQDSNVENKAENDSSTKPGFDVDDPLGLLKSKHIAAAAADASHACNSEKTRKRKYKSEDERLEANRKSAAESRHRKKVLLENLQKSIGILQEENTKLRLENDMLKQQLNLNHGHSQSATQATVMPFNSGVNSALLSATNTAQNLLGECHTGNPAPLNPLLRGGGLPQQNVPYPLNGSNGYSGQILNGNQIDGVNMRNTLVARLLQNSLLQNGDTQNTNGQDLSQQFQNHLPR